MSVSSSLRRKRGELAVDLLQPGGVLVELAGIGRIEERRVDDRDLVDAAHLALEAEAGRRREMPGPAALAFLGKPVEAPGDIGRGTLRLLGLGQDALVERAGDRHLLDDERS